MILATYLIEPSFLPDRVVVGAMRTFKVGLWVDYVDNLPVDVEIMAFPYLAEPTDFNQLWVRNGPPDDGLGINGDQWFDMISANLWHKENGTFY